MDECIYYEGDLYRVKPIERVDNRQVVGMVLCTGVKDASKELILRDKDWGRFRVTKQENPEYFI